MKRNVLIIFILLLINNLILLLVFNKDDNSCDLINHELTNLKSLNYALENQIFTSIELSDVLNEFYYSTIEFNKTNCLYIFYNERHCIQCLSFILDKVKSYNVNSICLITNFCIDSESLKFIKYMEIDNLNHINIFNEFFYNRMERLFYTR